MFRVDYADHPLITWGGPGVLTGDQTALDAVHARVAAGGAVSTGVPTEQIAVGLDSAWQAYNTICDALNENSQWPIELHAELDRRTSGHELGAAAPPLDCRSRLKGAGMRALPLQASSSRAHRRPRRGSSRRGPRRAMRPAGASPREASPASGVRGARRDRGRTRSAGRSDAALGRREPAVRRRDPGASRARARSQLRAARPGAHRPSRVQQPFRGAVRATIQN